ncbi:MAG: DUF935 domain-containing protein [Panacagrimonas sp.]
MAQIVGPDGQPLRKQELLEEIAGPTVTGVRQVFTGNVARGLTPERLASMLDQAADQDARDYLTLAEEMEERDPHYLSVLGTRKHAITGLEFQVEAASEDSADVKIADAVRELFAGDDFADTAEELLDALGKSYSVVEIIWDMSERQWQPMRFEHRDPRWFRVDRETRRQLRLITEENSSEGVPLAPFKFMVHTPKIKTGILLRNGLARIVAFMHVCKSYALKDWLAFAEVFGMPLRVGKYGPSATPRDVYVLRQAVANIGTDAAAVIPESMKIEFEQVGNVTGAHQLFEGLSEYLDKQTSKAVLGQTNTTDAQSGGLGSGQADVHNEVRKDILRADARQLCKTLNRDLVRAFVDLNFGPQKKYPVVKLPIPEPEDIAAMVDAVTKLVPMGMKVGAATMRDKIGIPDPDDDEELLTAPAPPPSPFGAPGGGPDPEDDPQPPQRAANAARRGKAAADLPQLQAARLDVETEPAMTAMIDRIKRLVAESTTLDELRDRLIELQPELDDEKLANAMRMAFAAASLAGRSDILAGT